jgi:hypothetical protein
MLIQMRARRILLFLDLIVSEEKARSVYWREK